MTPLQTVAKLSSRQNTNAVVSQTALGFQANNDPLSNLRVVLDQVTQAAEMIVRDSPARLCLDSDVHIVNNEIHLDLTSR